MIQIGAIIEKKSNKKRYLVVDVQCPHPFVIFYITKIYRNGGPTVRILRAIDEIDLNKYNVIKE